MKKTLSLASVLAVIGFSTLFVAAPASACASKPSGPTACASRQAQDACPAPGARADAQAPSRCLVNPELLDAAGEAATNGLRMAATVMRSLAVEMDRRLAPVEPRPFD